MNIFDYNKHASKPKCYLCNNIIFDYYYYVAEHRVICESCNDKVNNLFIFKDDFYGQELKELENSVNKLLQNISEIQDKSKQLRDKHNLLKNQRILVASKHKTGSVELEID